MSALARAAAVAVIGALALATAACTDASPTPTPLSTPTAETPIFASDEEALAAAEEAYARYVALDAEILAAGGEGAEHITEVVSPAYAQRLIPEYEEFSANGFRSTGQARLGKTSIVEVTGNLVTIYGCLDVSDVHLWNAVGEDVTPSGRQLKQALVLGFVHGGDLLKLDWSDKWTGDDFC